MLSGGRPAHPITGRGGKSIDAVWAQGPQTYFGLTVAGFPNMFLVTSPGSPSVLSNMTVSIEQHVDWVVDRLMAHACHRIQHHPSRTAPASSSAKPQEGNDMATSVVSTADVKPILVIPSPPQLQLQLALTHRAG